jgi:hypothetical protein
MAASETPPDRPPRGRLTLGPRARRVDRNPRAFAVAVVLHVAVAVLLLRTITVNTGLRSYFGFDAPVVEEQVTFVETPPVTPAAEPPPPRDPGIVADRDQVSRGPELAPPDAPIATPAPPPAPARRYVEAGDTVGGRVLTAPEAAVVGVRPGGDARLWVKADVEALQRAVRGAALYGGVPGARELDSVITVTLLAAKDSLDSLRVLQTWGPLTAAWTKQDGKGGTWGLDEKGLRLGKVTIPSALLGLLPMGAQQAMMSNPTVADRNRQLSYAQSDIARFRQSGPGNDMFKSLVDELRERKDREREERRKLNAARAAQERGAGDQAAGNGSGRP